MDSDYIVNDRLHCDQWLILIFVYYYQFITIINCPIQYWPAIILVMSEETYSGSIEMMTGPWPTNGMWPTYWFSIIVL